MWTSAPQIINANVCRNNPLARLKVIIYYCKFRVSTLIITMINPPCNTLWKQTWCKSLHAKDEDVNPSEALTSASRKVHCHQGWLALNVLVPPRPILSSSISFPKYNTEVIPTLANMSKWTPLLMANFLISSLVPGSWPPNWLQGKPRMTSRGLYLS